MKSLFFLAAFCIAASLGASASAEIAVEVEYSTNLDNALARINAIERKRESNFRKYRDDIGIGRIRTEKRLAKSLVDGVNWANEFLVPDLNDFNVTNLLSAMVRKNLLDAGLGDLDGTIRIKIDRFKVANHSYSFLRGPHSYVTGSFTHIDGAGAIIKSAPLSANLILNFTVNRSYQGPDFAYSDSDPDNRVGPTLTYFVKRGLDKLFPGNKFAKPIVITYN